MRIAGLPLLALVVFMGSVTTAHATPILVRGATFPDQAQAAGQLNIVGNTLTLQLKNVSPFDTRITGLGFDLNAFDFSAKGKSSSGLDGYTAVGSVSGFTFRDGPLGQVPQFNDRVLDFGWTTGPNFAGGSPNNALSIGNTLTFVVQGNFLGLTEDQLASALFVRFQRIGPNDDSDVGQGGPGSTIPEPASLLLLGTGLALAAVRRRKAIRR